jgi:O-antigen/teichoic acid export membrane protein
MARLDPAVDGVTEAGKQAPDTEGVDLQSLARGGVFALAGSAVTGVLGFALTVLLTRNVDTVTVGVVFTMVSVFMMAFTVVRLGASTGAVYFIARLSALGESERLRSALRSALTPVFWVSVLASVVLIALAGPLARLIVPAHPQQAIGALRVMALFLPFAAIMDVCLFGTRGLHRLRPLIFIDKMGRPALQVLAVGLCIGIGATTPTQLALAWAGPYLPAAILAGAWLWYLLAHAEKTRGVAATVPGTMHREFWGYSWPRWLQSIAQIGLQRLDIILVAALSGPTDAAVYAAVTRFLVFGQLAASAIGAVAQPRLSRLVALRDDAGVRTVYRVSTTWLILTAWPIYLSFVVFAAQLPLVFGQQYASGTTVLVVLGLAMLVSTGCGLVDVVLAMAGKTFWTFANATIALVVMVVADLLLIPVLGITGAAIGWAAAIVFNNLVPLTQVGVQLRLHPFGRSTWMAALVAVGTLGAVPGALALAHEPLGVLIAAFGVGLLAYSALVWRFRVLFSLHVLSSTATGRAPA